VNYGAASSCEGDVIMVMPVELDQKEIAPPKCHVLSFSSVGMSWERSLFVIALAQSFSNQGYRVLVVDLDFEVPIIAASLADAGVDLSTTMYTNDWFTAEEKLTTDELMQQLATVPVNPIFPVSVIPGSPDAKKLKLTQEMDKKATRRALRRMTKFFKEVKKEELFDIILLNVPYMTPHAINGMMAADYNFVIVDHDGFSFSMLERYIDAMVGIYPMLNIAGIILHRFQYSPAPGNDAVIAALIEEQLKFPVIAKLPSIRDKLIPRLEKQVWSIQNLQVQEFFESTALDLSSFALSPRRVLYDG